MTKLLGPMFSLDARGKMGGSLVYAIRRGVNYARQMATPSDPKSDPQLQMREVFADGISKWRFAPDLISNLYKTSWNYYAAGTSESGHNRFMRYYLKANYDTATKTKVTPQVIPAPQ